MSHDEAMLIAFGNLLETGAMTGPATKRLDAAIDRRLNDDKTVDSLLDDVVRAGEEPERFENIA